MYESRAMQVAAAEVAALATMKPAKRKYNGCLEGVVSGIVKGEVAQDFMYASPTDRRDLSSTCTNPTYIIRNILLKNINRTATIEKSGKRTDDYILRPVALLDIAYRDLQACKSFPMSEGEKRRYHRTIKYMHAIFGRMYRHMGDEQIFIINEYMENMENSIQHDLDVLKVQLLESLRSGILDDGNREHLASIAVIHACVDLPIMYMASYLNTRITELEEVSKNVQLMMRYYATTDSGNGDIDLNKDAMIGMCVKAFMNRFFSTELVTGNDK